MLPQVLDGLVSVNQAAFCLKTSRVQALILLVFPDYDTLSDVIYVLSLEGLNGIEFEQAIICIYLSHWLPFHMVFFIRVLLEGHKVILLVLSIHIVLLVHLVQRWLAGMRHRNEVLGTLHEHVLRVLFPVWREGRSFHKVGEKAILNHSLLGNFAALIWKLNAFLVEVALRSFQISCCLVGEEGASALGDLNFLQLRVQLL